MNAPERFEQLIAFLSAQLPQPVEQQPASDGSIIFSGGSPAEVVAHLTETSVVISEYAGTWEIPSTFTVRPRRVGVLKWRRLPQTELMSAIAQLIKGAREMRLARYRTCRYCTEVNPPEWMESDEVCVGCADSQMQVVH
jgi:hypothetical protein